MQKDFTKQAAKVLETARALIFCIRTLNIYKILQKKIRV